MDNREIKFRVWDKEDKKMLYYDTNIVPDITLNGVLIDEKRSNMSYLFILMQYTGLKDKNGKKIFEGDIVREKVINVEIIWQVKWEFNQWIFKNKYNARRAFVPKSIKVIGNIFENKNLLKLYIINKNFGKYD